MKKIVVIGSANTDLVVKTSHIPKPGETVLGGKFIMTPGGKGANQAITAARLGGNTLFISHIGNDLFGQELVRQYTKEKMEIINIRTEQESPSGIALITVDEKGENCIVVASGANHQITPKDIDAVKEEIISADYILMQLEIPMEIVEYVTEIASAAKKKIILNPAPAAHLSDELLQKLYLITPNKTEVQQLTGQPVNTWEEAEIAAGLLLDKGIENVVITLGSMGALIKTPDGCERVPALPVQAIDTTAAGDVFNGALCVALAEEMELSEGVRFATKASALSVTKMGAQTSIPYREELWKI